MSKKKGGLGMGLEGLLGSDPDEPVREAAEPAVRGAATAKIPELPLAEIQAGHYQPRAQFDDEALRTLAESIKTHGVLQPIVVRLRADALKPYEILAGERRFRAAGLAGLTHIPAIIREADNEQALALALIENIQREDLNPIEEAQAIKRLIDEFDYSHEVAAQAIGRSRSATSNLLRLLALATQVQQRVIDGQIEMGHARALLALNRADQIMVANRIVERGLSVRETEAAVTAHLGTLESSGSNGTVGSSSAGAGAQSPARPDRDVLRLQQRLSDILAAPVTIRTNRKGKGKMIIEFSGPDQFDGLIDQLGLRRKLDES